MSNTENNLNIVEIIKACGESKVRRFKYGKVEIEFGDTDELILKRATELVTEKDRDLGPTQDPAFAKREVVEIDDDLILTDPDQWMKNEIEEIENEEAH